MAMADTLRRFGEQFTWEPEVINAASLGSYDTIIVCGMGGSHLGAWLLKQYAPANNIFIHRSYGLPALPDSIYQNALVIASSYSGGTEETIDAAQEALARGLPLAAISTGGKLIEFAARHAVPHVVIPQTDIQPRSAIGFSMLGIARLMSAPAIEAMVRQAGLQVNPEENEQEGVTLAQHLQGKVPLIYASARNLPLAYIWKIKCNETAKIPAFCNAFPEMCHNELNGLDVVDSTRPLSAAMHVLFLDDEQDHPRIRRRMQVASDVFAERAIPVEHLPLAGSNGFEKAFRSALLADWVSLSLAHHYGVPDEAVPMVEGFKKRIG